MFPILYENIERDILAVEAPKLRVPQHHGLGTLSDCISCEVEQARNGIYELVMEYSASGIHASEIANRRLLKVKPNPTDDPQLFRIDRIGKTMNGKFTCYAKHISYDISGYFVSEGSAINMAKACEVLTEATNEDFKIHTSRQVTADFSIKEPSSVKSWFAGKEGSLLDVYGSSEIKYNNFDVSFLVSAGENRGVKILYGKNLLELSQELDSSNLYTAVVCYYKGNEGSAVVGDPVSTGLELDVPNVLAVDVTGNYQETPSQLQLTADAVAYKNSHNLVIPSNNIKLDFVQSGELTNRVDLCDIVTVYYEALDISGTMKCIRTKYDCLREKYIETEFGDVKVDLADTISDSTSRVDDAVSAADAALSAVGSKKRVFVNQPVPPYDIGDLWMNDGAVYYCTTPKTETIIKETEMDSIASFDSSVNVDLIEFECEIEANPEGYEHLIISVADEDMEIQKAYNINLGENLTQGGVFRLAYVLDEGEYVLKAILTRTDTTTKEYDISQIDIPETIVGHNNIFCNTGDIAVKYYEAGFSQTDWELATDYVTDSVLESSIARSAELITGGLGGNVVIQRTPETEDGTGGRPYEIVIFKTEYPTDPQDLDHAKYVWRWNAGGLAYTDGGYNSENYKVAIDSEGHINASMIATGDLDAVEAGIQNLTASMFAGQMIQLGGSDMPNGKIVILDQSNNTLIQMDINGLECFGATVGGITPSVVFDKNGVTAYSNSADKENTAIFWTQKDSFQMKNAVIKNQMDIGELLKFTPMTIRNANNEIINQGIAVVPTI